MGNESSSPEDVDAKDSKKGKRRGRFVPSAGKGNMTSRNNLNTNNTNNESWTFVRGSPPKELLRLPAQAPKRFATRSAQQQQTYDASQATNVFPCFRGGGLLFRIVDPDDSGWWFYNDTSDMEMHVEYHFGPGSVLDVGEHVVTEPSGLPGFGGEGWQSASMIVFPGETLLFITGASRINGYKSVFRIAPLSEQVAQRQAGEIAAVVAKMSNEMDVVAKLTADLGGGNTCLIEEAIVDRCARQQVPFVDLNFPPTQDSMYGFSGASSLLQIEQEQQQHQQESHQDGAASPGVVDNRFGGAMSPESSGTFLPNRPSMLPSSSSTATTRISSPIKSELLHHQPILHQLSSESEFTTHVRRDSSSSDKFMMNDNRKDDDESYDDENENENQKQSTLGKSSATILQKGTTIGSSPRGDDFVAVTISSITAEVAGGSRFASEYGASDSQLTAQLESDARDLHRRLPPVVWMRPKQYLLADNPSLLAMSASNNINNNIQNNNNNRQNNHHYHHHNNNHIDILEQQHIQAVEAALDATVSCTSRGIHVTDIELGFLGDHWLLSAISCVAEHPELIRWIFRSANPLKLILGNNNDSNNSNNSNNSGGSGSDNTNNSSNQMLTDITALKTLSQSVGAYKLYLNVSGWWTSIILDDYIPCIGNRPAFASSKRDRRELWPILLQKSFAKIAGSYAGLVAGDPLLAIRTMTGFPSFRIDKEWSEATRNSLSRREPDEHFITTHLIEPFLEGYSMCVNTKGIDSTFSLDLSEANQLHCQEVVNKYESIGLQMGCAYSVVDMKYFPQWKLFLMKIRNPWLLNNNTATNPTDNPNLNDPFLQNNNEGNNKINNNKNESTSGKHNTNSSTTSKKNSQQPSNNVNPQQQQQQQSSSSPASQQPQTNTGSWTGNWSWQSDMWMRFPEVAAECKPLECRLEGDNFWMSWEDAINYFEGGGISLYRSPVSVDLHARRDHTIILTKAVPSQATIVMQRMRANNQGLSLINPHNHKSMALLKSVAATGGALNPPTIRFSNNNNVNLMNSSSAGVSHQFSNLLVDLHDQSGDLMSFTLGVGSGGSNNSPLTVAGGASAQQQQQQHHHKFAAGHATSNNNNFLLVDGPQHHISSVSNSNSKSGSNSPAPALTPNTSQGNYNTGTMMMINNNNNTSFGSFAMAPNSTQTSQAFTNNSKAQTPLYQHLTVSPSSLLPNPMLNNVGIPTNINSSNVNVASMVMSLMNPHQRQQHEFFIQHQKLFREGEGQVGDAAMILLQKLQASFLSSLVDIVSNTMSVINSDGSDMSPATMTTPEKVTTYVSHNTSSSFHSSSSSSSSQNHQQRLLLARAQQQLQLQQQQRRFPLPIVDHRVMGQFIGSMSSVCLEVTVKRRTRLTFVLSQADSVGARAEAPAAIMLSVAEPTISTTSSVSSSSPSSSLLYNVRCNSTLNPLAPSPEFNFSIARDLSVVVDLEPTTNLTTQSSSSSSSAQHASPPYLIIPRAFDAGVNKRYVLGVLAEDLSGNSSSSSSSFRAKFVQIGAESPFFLNRRLVRHRPLCMQTMTTTSSSSLLLLPQAITALPDNESTIASASCKSVSKSTRARYQIKQTGTTVELASPSITLSSGKSGHLFEGVNSEFVLPSSSTTTRVHHHNH